MSKEHRNICHSKTFESIYKAYAKDIRRFLFFKTQDLNKAEDLMQDVFIKLWDNCGKVDYDKVKSYIFSIANNMFLNAVKHEKVVRDYNKLPTKGDTNESPEFIMLEKEFMEKLENTIADLPGKAARGFFNEQNRKEKVQRDC